MNRDAAIPFARAGEVLYGERWRQPLADRLGVSQRTIRRWAAEPARVPASARALIRQALNEHAGTAALLAKQF